MLLHVDLTSCKLQGRRLLALQNPVRVPIAPFEGLGSPDAPAVKERCRAPPSRPALSGAAVGQGVVGGRRAQQTFVLLC
jgi:hypothetical protein